jgi:hypothetical protein
MELPIESEDELEGVLLPTMRTAGEGDVGNEQDDGEGDASDQDVAEDARPIAEAEDEAEADEGDGDGSGGSGLPDALSAFDPSSAPPGAELDPFRTTGSTAAPTKSTGLKAAQKTLDFDMVRYDKEHLANRRLFVGGVPHDASEAALLKFFSQWGKVQEVRLGVHADTGKSRGFAFIVYAYHKGARFCLEQGAEKQLGGRELRCEVAAAGEKRKLAGEKRPAPAPPPHAGDAKRAPQRGGRVDARAAPAPPPPGDDAKRKRSDKGIVTVTRREDAEPVEKLRITTRDLFPKEFWRI